MQWALLAIGVVVVLGVYWHARRQAAKQAVWHNKRKREGQEEDQLDFFAQEQNDFDEFGVGRARSRQEPVLDGPPGGSDATSSGDDPGAGAGTMPEQRLFVISVYRSDLQYIPGDELHRALSSCGLEFGQHEIYHRFSPQGDVVFSVASIVKPGFLRPDEADELRTPGVSLFLQLPGPQPGAQAFEDLLATAQTLAERFDATLLDRARKPLSNEQLADMRKDCEAYPAQ